MSMDGSIHTMEAGEPSQEVVEQSIQEVNDLLAYFHSPKQKPRLAKKFPKKEKGIASLPL